MGNELPSEKTKGSNRSGIETTLQIEEQDLDDDSVDIDFVQVNVDENIDELDGDITRPDDGIDCQMQQREWQDSPSLVEQVVDSEVNFVIHRPRVNNDKRPTNNEQEMNMTPKLVTMNRGDNDSFQREVVDDPRIENYIQQQIDKRWKEKEKEIRHLSEDLSLQKGIVNENQNRNSQVNSQLRNLINPQNSKGTKQRVVNQTIKSLSDTTLYTPGLRKSPEKMNQQIDRELIDKISNFVEGMHLTGRYEECEVPTLGTSTQQKGEAVVQQQQDNQQVEDARSVAGKMLLDAERYKAAVSAPKGMPQDYYLNRNQLFVGVLNDRGTLMDDDEFFHITCHVDPTLRQKIEHGEFVDLEKLLTKEKFKNKVDEGRLEFFNKDGHMYLAPANRELKITNVKGWEQAF